LPSNFPNKKLSKFLLKNEVILNKNWKSENLKTFKRVAVLMFVVNLTLEKYVYNKLLANESAMYLNTIEYKPYPSTAIIIATMPLINWEAAKILPSFINFLFLLSLALGTTG
jgi:hypothetical protein